MKKFSLALAGGAFFLLLFIFRAQAQTPVQEPVVIVPGLSASLNWDVMLDTNPSPHSNLNGWSFMLGTHYYDNLITTLRNSLGNDKVFVAFYDWRRPNQESAVNYLKPVIDQAKLVSPTGKVNIVAHSMGGLVARAYIEGIDYENDVDHLITLGTPHYGSSDSYGAWEGGYLGDISVISILETVYLDLISVTAGQTYYQTIKNNIPSLKELLPTYDYLNNTDGNAIPTNILQEQNPLLPILNTTAGLHTLYERVKVATIAGDTFSTLQNIPVVSASALEQSQGLWSDGKPNPFPPVKDSTEGDDRVLRASALLPDIADAPPPPLFLRAPTWRERLVAFIFPKAQAQFFGPPLTQPTRIALNSCHTCLPQDAIQTVLGALGLDASINIPPPVPDPQNYLAYYFASPVSVSVTDPQGHTISKNSNTIPGAEYSDDGTSNGPRLVLIPNPLAGQYTIGLTGTGNGEFHLGAQYFGATITEPALTTSTITTGQTLNFTTTLNTTGTPSLTQPNLVEPPAPQTMRDLPALLNQLVASGYLHHAQRTVRGRSVVVRSKSWLVQTLTRYSRAYERLDQRCTNGDGTRPLRPFPLACQQAKERLVKLMYQVIGSNTPSMLTPTGATALREFLKEATGIDTP